MSEVHVSLKLFSDFREAITGFAGDIAALADIPKRIRKQHIDVIDETMTVIDSALLLVMNRLGGLLQVTDESTFSLELSNLDYWDDWLRIERDLRLCHSLRLARREMDGILDQLKSRIALCNPEAVRAFFTKVLEGEGELAMFISKSLSNLAAMSHSEFDKAKKQVREAREAFRQERNKLISDQIKLYGLV